MCIIKNSCPPPAAPVSSPATSLGLEMNIGFLTTLHRNKYSWSLDNGWHMVCNLKNYCREDHLRIISFGNSCNPWPRQHNVMHLEVISSTSQHENPPCLFVHDLPHCWRWVLAVSTAGPLVQDKCQGSSERCVAVWNAFNTANATINILVPEICLIWAPHSRQGSDSKISMPLVNHLLNMSFALVRSFEKNEARTPLPVFKTDKSQQIPITLSEYRVWRCLVRETAHKQRSQITSPPPV